MEQNYQKTHEEKQEKNDNRCKYCGIPGHWVSTCRIRQSDREKGTFRNIHPNFDQHMKKFANQNKNVISKNNQHELNIMQVTEQATANFRGPVNEGTINNLTIHFLIDTGASASFITKEIAIQANLNIEHEKKIMATSYTGQTSTTLGM
ncbi:hypothetical protein HMI54_014161, partial [Coelomomyces lativittatus]